MELVSALKEGAVSSSLVPHLVKTKKAENVFVENVEKTFPSEAKENVHASTSASTLNPIFPLSDIPRLHMRH